MNAAASMVDAARVTDWPVARFAGPLFDAVRGPLNSLSTFPDLVTLNRLARNAALQTPDVRPLAFVTPAAIDNGMRVVDDQYESRVQRDAAIETRPDNWHDVFNALIWLAWPRAKAALNALHVRELGSATAAGRRGVARDVATLFDESGAVIACADVVLATLLKEFRWKELFCGRRDRVESHLHCYVFGHALLDRARRPYKGMTAHALIFPVTQEFFAQKSGHQIAVLDGMLADWFGDAANPDSTAKLAPLPVLGFPGFFAANADPRFYDDATVFRPGRQRKPR
jgi:hypothetical protein